MDRRKFYVGVKSTLSREVFSSLPVPTEETILGRYLYAIGPFRTKRGAEFMAKHGANNPHCVTVQQAEKLAKGN
jgi:hypothetical protein